MATINLDIGGNTSRLDRDIQKTVNKVYNINLKTKGDQPLGRITGKINEFNKSLDASNARVIAFGASAGIIYGLQKAFSSLVSSTIEVQKSLQDINVILNVSTKQLNQFGSDLFNIAKNTGQSFQEVAQAATEFSRQGLGLAETLKRTNEALILSRLSGLDTVKSVEALTAAVNSFASQAVTATDVVNKFANVDAAFAVSSADLAEAISRVGSSAAQSGVSLNELIALVTSAQQTTARGGAVIGNSFKTIFTRLQRGKVIDLLGNLGISDVTAGGEVKSTIQLLQELAKVYDTLGARQQAAVAEQVGGVFQINILKAALADLGKEYSIYNSALSTAESSTDQAIKRNEQLNKTYAAQLNALQQNAKQLAGNVGGRVLGPAFERVVGGANQILGGINESDGENVGSILGKGILDGLGQILAGPGLVVIGGILLKLTKDFAKFGLESGKGLLGLNTAAEQQRSIQESINIILQKNPKLLDLALKSEQGLNQAANSLFASLQKQTIELEKQAAVASQIAKSFYGAGVRVSGGIPVAPKNKGKAAGFIPNFASDRQIEKAQAMALGATSTVRPHLSEGTIGGRKFIMNSQETEFPGVGKNGDSMVIPKYAKGFIPNFAQDIGKWADFAKSQELGLKLGNKFSTDYKQLVKIVNKNGGKRSDSEIEEDIKQLAASRKGITTTVGALKGAGKFGYLYASKGEEKTIKGKVRLTKNGEPVSYSFTSAGTKRPFGFEKDINDKLTPIITDLAKQILPTNSELVPVNGGADFNKFIDKSAFSQIYGRLFEAVINRALGKVVQEESGNQRFEFFNNELSGPNGTKLQKIFNSSQIGSFAAADLKYRSPAGSPESTLSFIKKMAAVTGIPYDASRGATKLLTASGFIPNFASTNRGVPVSQIRAHFDKSGNPIAVTNTRDEPNGLKDAIGRERKGIGMYSRGFIPNFVNDVAGTPVGPTIAALVTEFSVLAFALKDLGASTKLAKTEIIESANQQLQADQQRLQSLKKGTQEYNNLNSSITKTSQKIKKLEGGGFSGEAFVQSISNAMLIAAPIIGQTIKNLIGSETKSARVAGSVVEGASSALSFASLAAQVAPKGKGKAAGIAALITAAISLKDVFNEAATNLPELTRASDEAAQKLSQFENISQQANTALEQIIELKNKGQATEAGKLEIKTLSDIFSQVPDINVASKMQRAIENKDTEALKKAIDENTQALREQKEKTERATAVDASLQNIRNLQPGIMGSLGNVFSSQASIDKSKQKRDEKVLNEAKNIFNAPLLSLKDKSGNRLTGQQRITELTNLGNQNKSLSGYTEVLKKLGFDEAQIEQFVADEATIRPVLQKIIQEQVDAEASKLRNTEAGNPIIKQIVDSMNRIKSYYDEYASAVSEGTNYQIEANAGIKNALGRIKVGQLQSEAELTSAFTGEGSAATRQANTAAELAKINTDFTATISEPVTDAMKTLESVLQSSVAAKLGVMATPGDNQASAEKNFATLQAELPGLLKSLNIGNLEDVLGLKNFNLETFKGFDVKEILKRLQPSIQGEDATKSLDELKQKLIQTNSILFEQKRIQQEQKTLLAQQKFTEIAKAFINAALTSFGGFESFLKDNFSEMSKSLDDAATNIKIIGANPQTREGQIEFGRQLGILTTELSKMAGMNIGPDLSPEIIGAIQNGQAKYIEDNLNEVFASLQGVGGGVADAFRKTLSAKFDPSGNLLSNKDIAEKTAEAQTKAQYELVPKIYESIKASAEARLGKDPQGQELLKLLKDPASAFLDPQSYTNVALDLANKTLSDILDAIKNPEANPPEKSKTSNLTPLDEKGNPIKPPPPVMGYAGGFFPAFANSKESIIPNFWNQYKKEQKDQSKYGYSGGKPLLLNKNNFNPLKDAIANPMQMALFGGMKSKSLNAASGYFPNFANNDWSGIGLSVGEKASETSRITGAKEVGKLQKLLRGFNSKSLSRLLKTGVRTLGVAGSLTIGTVTALNRFQQQLDQGVDKNTAIANAVGEGLTSNTLLTTIPGVVKGAFTGVKQGAGGLLGKANVALAYAQMGWEGFQYFKNPEKRMNQVLGQLDYTPTDAFSMARVKQVFNNAWVGLSNPAGMILSAAGLLGGQKLNPTGTQVPDIVVPPTTVPTGPTPKISPPGSNYTPPNWQPYPNKPSPEMGPMGPELPDLATRKAIAEKEIQKQLSRVAMGASAEFKKYDKDYNYTGIKELYGTPGVITPGSRMDIAKKMGDLNREIQSTRDPSRAMALARQRDALKIKFIKGDFNLTSSRGDLFGEGMGAKTLVSGKISEAKPNGLNRVVTDKSGRVIGYSRYNPLAKGNPNILLGGNGIMPADQMNMITGKTTPVPRAMPVFKMGNATTELGTTLPNKIEDLGKLDRTVKKEQSEAGVPKDQVYSLKLPELETPENPEGVAVFNTQDEKSIEEARKAVKRSQFTGGGGKSGGGGASGTWAGGYFPNFADKTPDTNNVNVSVGVNITANTSASNINKDELAAQIKNLLEVEVPKLNALQARVDRMGDVVTKVQNENPGKYNLPPKQIPK